jgi:hypothetical protein
MIMMAKKIRTPVVNKRTVAILLMTEEDKPSLNFEITESIRIARTNLLQRNFKKILFNYTLNIT